VHGPAIRRRSRPDAVSAPRLQKKTLETDGIAPGRLKEVAPTLSDVDGF
jgi:hypothetical protein